MAYRDLVVHVDTCDSCNERISAAVALARKHGAHLKGVALALKSSISTYLGIDIPTSLTEQQQKLVREATEQAMKTFEKMASEAGISFDSEIIECGAAKAPAALSFHARHADMTFIGQPDPDGGRGSFQETLLEGVLFSSGRPVYIVPYVGRPHMEHRKAVIAWDGGRKAVRAVNDAIPLLQAREEVFVVVVNPDKRKDVHGPKPGRDIARHLERHDVNATVVPLIMPEAAADTVILNYLTDSGSDLLVMGAYSHSRLREKAFGGVTNTIIHHMTTPVVMSE